MRYDDRIIILLVFNFNAEFLSLISDFAGRVLLSICTLITMVRDCYTVRRGVARRDSDSLVAFTVQISLGHPPAGGQPALVSGVVSCGRKETI